MPRKTLFIVACIFIGLLFSALCTAQERKEEWKNPMFDFNQIKTVAVRLSLDKSICPDEIEQRKLNDLIKNQVLKAANTRLRLISNEQFETAIEKYSGLNLNQLRVDDVKQYEAAMREWAPLITDAFLNVDIKQWGYTKVFVPESTYTYTDYVTNYITVPYYDPHGNLLYRTQPIQVPVERTQTIPAHYDSVAHAGAQFSLITAKGRQKVWMLLDLRDAGGSKEPIEMTGRIVTRAMERLREVTKKDR
ncbi:Hypothetical protein LUCI_0205 [Lucifera butyrica]|uniref:Uncharacterized protein n=1 Tax=Lucifera butyrica TaxID=1351585 RepID=A0A498R1A6_9FIRM|nr:hypothetical protein [Lucifera butyrica]VBB04999.1 Hypothetical protein LUCI_0205 [Lucifera butyrica]